MRRGGGHLPLSTSRSRVRTAMPSRAASSARAMRRSAGGGAAIGEEFTVGTPRQIARGRSHPRRLRALVYPPPVMDIAIGVSRPLKSHRDFYLRGIMDIRENLENVQNVQNASVMDIAQEGQIRSARTTERDSEFAIPVRRRGVPSSLRILPIIFFAAETSLLSRASSSTR
jgi:hypothetical protein